MGIRHIKRERRKVRDVRDSENSFQYVSHKKKTRGTSLLIHGLERCRHIILRPLMFSKLTASDFPEKSSHEGRLYLSLYLYLYLRLYHLSSKQKFIAKCKGIICSLHFIVAMTGSSGL